MTAAIRREAWRYLTSAAALLAIGHGAAHAQSQEHADMRSNGVYSPPPITDADRAAAFPDIPAGTHGMMPEDPFNRAATFDRLEVQDADDGRVLDWDFEGWIGRNAGKLWIRSEGERDSSTTERAELQLLYGRPLSRWWDVVAGVREDFEPGESRGWAAFGVQGIAPYRFELEATAYLGEGGDSAARFEAEYELLITQRLIVQPRLQLDWYGQSDAERGIGSGLSTGEAGLRVRYEIRREIAPYIGLTRERMLGRTAQSARAAGIDTRDTRLVAGVRLWF